MVALGWVAATLVWWALAFAPLPAGPPGWVAAARAACFGPMETGWPAADGWMMLALAPASFLVGLAVLWGRELSRSLAELGRTPAGCGLLGVSVLAVLLGGSGVAGKLQASRAVTGGGATEAAAPLPPDYPRGLAGAPDFLLIDQHGSRVSLARLRGQPVVLTFVFAHCQALCPVVVRSVTRAASAPASGQVLLVTLDPWRDTPSVLPAVARQWALPGNAHVLSSRSTGEVLQVVRAYGVPFERNETTGDVVHPGLVFLIDAEGRLAYTFNNPSPAWIGEGLRRLAVVNGQSG